MTVEKVLFTLIIQAIIGVVSGGLGIWVGYAVLKERIKNMVRRLDKHEKQFERVVYRDTCNTCSGHHDERHKEVLRRLDELKDESKERFNQVQTGLSESNKAFRDCMDDLIKELQKETD